MFRSHANVLKPQRPLITDFLSNAARIPIAITTTITERPVYIQPIPNIVADDVDIYYDAPDHFSDDEFDEEQAPEDDISEMVIQFLPLAVWNNSEANEVEYILPPNFGENYIPFPIIIADLTFKFCSRRGF